MFRGPLFLRARGVCVAESGARFARAEGSSMGTISCVSFFVIQSCEAMICACCRDAPMHCVVPSARLTHVCGHIPVDLATSDCSCGLTRARRRALVSTAAQ